VSRELQSNSPSARMGLAGRSCQDHRVTVLYIYAGMVADLGYKRDIVDVVVICVRIGSLHTKLDTMSQLEVHSRSLRVVDESGVFADVHLSGARAVLYDKTFVIGDSSCVPTLLVVRGQLGKQGAHIYVRQDSQLVLAPDPISAPDIPFLLSWHSASAADPDSDVAKATRQLAAFAPLQPSPSNIKTIFHRGKRNDLGKHR
jgi:hypothetical protein